MDTNEKPERQEIDSKMLGMIHTRPGLTQEGKPFDHVDRRKVDRGECRQIGILIARWEGGS